MQTASYHEQKNHKYRSLVVFASLSLRVSEAVRNRGIGENTVERMDRAQPCHDDYKKGKDS
jgi:hypothetical protein